METTNGGTLSLADMLAGVEADLLVGREVPLARFRMLLADADRRPTCVWVSGSPGSGKSAFIRACGRLAQTLGWSCRLVAAEHLPPGAAIAALLAEGAPLVFGIDDYDRMGSRDGWFRTEILPAVGAGRCILLASRTPLAGAWASEAAWRSLAQEIRLQPLAGGDPGALLARLGVATPTARKELASLAAGSPRLLHLAAAAWNRTRGAQEPGLPSVAPAALEQFLHPGSRRLAWRPGAGVLDRLIAVAALLRTFDRPLLVGLAGIADGHAGAAWEEVVRLPFVESLAGPRYRLQDAVRLGLAAAVRRHLPWRERLWRRRAVAEQRGRLRAGVIWPGQAWLEVTELAREAPWYGVLHPAEEADWEVRSEAGPPPAAWRGGGGTGRWRTAAAAGGCLAVRDRKGGLLALGALLPPTPQDLGPGADRLPAHTLMLAGPCPPAQSVLLRELLGRAQAPAVAIQIGDGGAHRACALLGLGRPQRARGGAVGYLADLGRIAAGGWPPLGGEAPPPALHPGEAARQALAALRDASALARTPLGAWLAPRCGGTGATPGGWIEDALQAAEIRVGAVDGGALLRSYHLEGVRPHEAVAERFGLPRTTYFRTYRQALALLGAALLETSPPCRRGRRHEA